jgi:hypothetical protein
MVFPAIRIVGRKHVVENHHTKTQHDELSDVPNVKRCIEAIGFQRLPLGVILVAECADVLPQNVAKKSQFEAFVKSIRRNDDFFLILEKKNLASFWMNVELQDRKKNRDNCDRAQQYECRAGILK